MQTERVTFLTTPDHKAALDAYATSKRQSVGHVLREASSRYIAEAAASRDEDEEALDLALPELEAAVEEMKATISTMRADMKRACEAIDAILADDKA